VCDLEQKVNVLERQVNSLRREQHAQHEWLDTLATPPWKKVLFWLQGYKWYTVGRWRK
jgi:hypothetical protein